MKLLLPLSLISQTLAYNIIQPEQGICSNFPSECPSQKQRKGVCCTQGHSNALGYHNNSCLACIAGCEVFEYMSGHRRCQRHEL